MKVNIEGKRGRIMNDLITRQSVLTMLQKIENAVDDGDGFQFNEWVEYAKNIPSAEKTAEWVYRGNNIICSNCGEKIPYGINNHYCRNCGAKMKGVEE